MAIRNDIRPPKKPGGMMPDDFGRVQLPKNLSEISPKNFDEDEIVEDDQDIDEIVPDEDSAQSGSKYRQDNQTNEIRRDQALQQQPDGTKTAGFQKPQEMPAGLPPEHPFSQENLIKRQLAGPRNAAQNSSAAVRRTATAGRQAAQKAWDDIKKKLTRQAIKAAARAAWSALVAFAGTVGLPVWGVVGIILAVIIGVIMLAIGIGAIWPKLHQSPSDTGQAMNQPLQPVADKGWLDQILLLIGDKSVASLKTNKIKTKLTETLKAETTLLATDKYKNFNRKTDFTSAITEMQGYVNNLSTAQTDAAAASNRKNYDNIRASATKLRNSLSAPFDKYPGTYGKGKDHYLPVDIPENQIGFAYTLHYKTKSNPVQPEKTYNGSHHWTYFFSQQNTGDAGDLQLADRTPVLAAFSGKISTVRPAASTRVLTSNDGKYQVLYAELNFSVNDGATVKAGDEIGKVNTGHVHLEVKIGGLPVNFRPEDINSDACGGLGAVDSFFGNGKGCKNTKLVTSGGHTTCTANCITQYYWAYIKQIFGS